MPSNIWLGPFIQHTFIQARAQALARNLVLCFYNTGHRSRSLQSAKIPGLTSTGEELFHREKKFSKARWELKSSRIELKVFS